MENSDIGITRETYRQGYTLIGFDVDPTMSPDFQICRKIKRRSYLTRNKI